MGGLGKKGRHRKAELWSVGSPTQKHPGIRLPLTGVVRHTEHGQASGNLLWPPKQVISFNKARSPVPVYMPFVLSYSCLHSHPSPPQSMRRGQCGSLRPFLRAPIKFALLGTTMSPKLPSNPAQAHHP